MRCVIVDLDGTISNAAHRQHFLDQTPRDWKGFFDACDLDLPHEAVIYLMRALFKAGVHLVICTGRPDSHREKTVRWLIQHEVVCDRLIMRAAGDYRNDAVVKKEMLDRLRASGLTPMFSVDDRPEVIQMWRENGVPCFAVDGSHWLKKEKLT